jgi:hypothetical protein
LTLTPPSFGEKTGISVLLPPLYVRVGRKPGLVIPPPVEKNLTFTTPTSTMCVGWKKIKNTQEKYAKGENTRKDSQKELSNVQCQKFQMLDKSREKTNATKEKKKTNKTLGRNSQKKSSPVVVMSRLRGVLERC